MGALGAWEVDNKARCWGGHYVFGTLLGWKGSYIQDYMSGSSICQSQSLQSIPSYRGRNSIFWWRSSKNQPMHG
jgi:hypothetical protein